MQSQKYLLIKTKTGGSLDNSLVFFLAISNLVVCEYFNNGNITLNEYNLVIFLDYNDLMFLTTFL